MWGGGVPHDPEPVERWHDRQSQSLVCRDEVLDRRQYPISRPALARGGVVAGKPAGIGAGLSGVEACVGQRLAILGWDLLWHVVVIAAAVRPADVVHQQQRQPLPLLLGALADDP